MPEDFGPTLACSAYNQDVVICDLRGRATVQALDTRRAEKVGRVSETTDNGVERGLGSRVDGVLRNIRIGGGLVGAAVTVGFFSKEVQRTLALPPLLKNDLYLSFLLLTFLLIGSWFLCALMHVEQMGKWSDPVNYQPPEEVIRIVAFAAVFIALIYATREALAFGIVYTIYVLMNLFTMLHLVRKRRK